MMCNMTDIGKAVDLVNGRSFSDDFSKYSYVFLFSTENQAGINKILSYKDKDVLTVASSGDQYLGAVYYGAKVVDVFDINRLTYYMTCLKIAAIYVLDFREFKEFFFPMMPNGLRNQNFWSLQVLNRLMPVMPGIVGLFWDNVMYQVRKGDYGKFVAPSNKKYSYDNILSGMPFYQSEEEYYKLQALLRKRKFPEFFESDIKDLGNTLTSTYDIAYLSNILEHSIAVKQEKLYYDPFCPSIYYEEHEKLEKSETIEVLDTITPHLREDGIVLLGYRSNNSDNFLWMYSGEMLDVDTISSKYRPDYINGRTDDVDMVLTYKPKRDQKMY